MANTPAQRSANPLYRQSLVERTCHDRSVGEPTKRVSAERDVVGRPRKGGKGRKGGRGRKANCSVRADLSPNQRRVPIDGSAKRQSLPACGEVLPDTETA